MKHLLSIAATAAALAAVRPSSAEEAPAPVTAPPPSSPPPLAIPTLLQQVHVEPLLEIVGGLKLDTVIQGSDEHREGRISAIMLSDFGLRGTVGEYVSFESQLMANGGAGLHGSSAWEGQAALQVRQQVVRVASGPWMGEVGRVLDEGSVDFFSAHVTDTMLQDTAARDPLLYSGFNLGDGVRGTFEAVPGLRVGLAFTAGNPVSNTASLQVGGSFPPFDRFYIQPYQAVNQSPNRYPDDTFHMMLFAPSVLYTSPIVEARAEFQSYIVDTNTNSTADQNLHGYNVRGTAKLKLLDDTISPFGNIAVDRNDTVDPNDVSKLAAPKYQSIVYGGGVDFNYAHAAPDRPDGIGLQYERVQYQVGSGDITNLHYINVGTTYWLNRWCAVGARFALWLQNAVGVHDEGERSGLLTLRIVL